MPARRPVVAAASGVAILSLLISSPVGAANNRNRNNDDDSGFERTTTTVKRKTSTTRDDREDAPRRTTTTARRATATTREKAADKENEKEKTPPTTGTTATPSSSAEEQATTTTEVAEADEKERPTNSYIVGIKKGNRAFKVSEEHKQQRGVKVQRVFAHAIRAYSADIPDDEVDAIKKDKRVAYVERTKPIEKFAQTLPWGVETVSRTGSDWSSTRPGDGAGGAVPADIYVLDTGIQSQADLNGGTVVNVRGGPSTDCDGHGTHMGGIVGAIDNTSGIVGVAPGARLHGVKSLDCTGRGTDAHAVAGLDWVIQHGARNSVVTMSFGGPISRAFDDAVRRAVNAGFTLITAAGNDHRNACNLSPAHMGELDGVITVGATTKRDRRASFSNFGSCVDIYAPGVQIPSYFLNGQIAVATGTSASAPHVAGVAALYLVGPGSDAPAAAEAAVKSAAVRANRGLLRASSATF